jgi:hypothetical protein
MNRGAIQVGPLGTVPAHQRQQILSGMRWTVWLAALSLPICYGTTALLARTGPEVIGTYGLLQVYIGVVTGILYLGNETVLVKLVPGIEPIERPIFLAAYFLIACLALLPLLARP